MTERSDRPKKRGMRLAGLKRHLRAHPDLEAPLLGELGVKQATLKSWLNGARGPSLPQLAVIARSTGMNIEELIGTPVTSSVTAATRLRSTDTSPAAPSGEDGGSMEYARSRLDPLIVELKNLQDPIIILEVVEILGPILAVCQRRKREPRLTPVAVSGDG